MKQQLKATNRWNLGMLTLLGVFLFITFACTQENSQSKLTDKAQIQREIFTIVEERNSGVEGTVQVQFVIERNGSISNAIAKSSIGLECDQEAIRVIESAPDFIAGSQRGRTVRTTMALPITFKLNQEKRNPDNSIQGTIIAGELVAILDKLKVTANYNNGEWSGTISSSDGDKLPGVNIVVAGTNYGTVSDLSGTFSVKAELDQALHISRIGYEREVIKN